MPDDPITTPNTPVDQPQPGSLAFTPAGPESIPVTEPKPTIETIKPQTERLASTEMGETQKPQTQTDGPPKDAPPIVQPNTTPTKPNGHVVNKTEKGTKLHPLTNSHDPLTTLADQEEEEFIKEVESAHGLR